MGYFSFFLKSAGLSKFGHTHAYDEEFSTEMYDKVFNTKNMPPYNSYLENGIKVTRSSNMLKLVYNGLLAESGAQDIYAIVGYGSNDKWENVKYYKMEKTGDHVFELALPVERDGDINIAFKDGANNWDNNSGMNYSFGNYFYSGKH